MAPKKGGLLLALGVKPKDGEDAPDDDEDPGLSDGENAAAEEILSAIGSKDAAALASALAAFIDSHR